MLQYHFSLPPTASHRPAERNVEITLRENLVELRLSAMELSTLERAGRIGGATEFGAGVDQRLVYALELSGHVSEPQTRLRNGIITIVLPSSTATALFRGEEPAIVAEHLMESGKRLSLRVERERSRESDESGVFEHAGY
jgi:hypothetical protein